MSTLNIVIFPQKGENMRARENLKKGNSRRFLKQFRALNPPCGMRVTFLSLYNI
jgi:hypothetical protein